MKANAPIGSLARAFVSQSEAERQSAAKTKRKHVRVKLAENVLRKNETGKKRNRRNVLPKASPWGGWKTH
jgi:hypothetical protein